jgi:hypothetical protein
VEAAIRRAEAALARMGRTIEDMQRILDEREWREVPTTPIPPAMLEQIRGR